MKLEEIRLRNFGPYFGEQSVPFTTSPEAPVIIIHGENTWGKTSFINAIRWCLYGRVRGIDRRDKALWRLVNKDAYKAGERTMEVRLRFTHDNVPHVLERRLGFNEAPGPKTRFAHKVNLAVDGIFVPEARVRDIISGILHEDISRFFLFDAEMLEQFERLVEQQSDTTATTIRQQIERALGLPAVTMAAEDMSYLQTLSSRKQFKSIRDTNKGSEIEAAARQVEDEIQSLESSLANMTQQRNDLEQRRDALKEKRSQFAELQAVVAELDQIDLSIQTLSAQHAQSKDDLKKSLSETWWLPVAGKLMIRVQTAKQEMESVSTLAAEAEAINRRLAVIRPSISGECAVCNQSIGANKVKEFKAEVDTLTRRLAEIEEPASNLRSVADRLAAVVPYLTATTPEQFRTREIQLRNLALDIRSLERKKKLIEEQIAGHDREDVRQTEKDYEAAVIDLNEIYKEIDNTQKRLDDFKTALSRLKKEAERLPGANPRIATEVALYTALEAIFDKSVDRFRDRMKKDVETEASKIFKQLTHEKNFDGLVINEHYGLIIKDKNGDLLPDRSAGAAQTIALALVAALNNSALREAPIVVDTPLGRLDLEHRANVLKFFPTMGKQVVFMPHTGEFDREIHLPLLEGKVSREMKIARENLQSRIVEFI